MFRFLISKKGFTVIELMIAVLIMGILAAIAIPVFSISLKSKKIEDCKSNRIIIESTLEEVMLGWEGRIVNGVHTSGGRPQRLHDDGNYSDDLNDEYSDNDNNPLTMFFWKPLTSLTTVEYKGETVKCFKLTKDEKNEGNLIFTISDIRGGWNGRLDYENFQDSTESTDPKSYKDWCLTHYVEDTNPRVIKEENRFYLKNREQGAKPFYKCLANEEIPVCPFSTEETPYFYYIFEDGSVICSCPHCQ